MSKEVQSKLIEIEMEKETGEEFKKVDIDSFKGEHKCPRCGFEWND